MRYDYILPVPRRFWVESAPPPKWRYIGHSLSDNTAVEKSSPKFLVSWIKFIEKYLFRRHAVSPNVHHPDSICGNKVFKVAVLLIMECLCF